MTAGASVRSGCLADPTHSGDPDQPSHSGQRKRRQILAGARAAFLDLGYEGASVDEISRRAQVSKGTLYNYFADKRTLFSAVVDEECREMSQRLFTVEPDCDCVETSLVEIARSFARFSVSPFALGMYRVAVAESQRIPEVGRAFYEAGPQLGTARLANFLRAACAKGLLVVEDADLAACQFTALCRADLFPKVLFGILEQPGDSEIDRVAEAAVRVFLDAHRPASAQDIAP